MTKAHQDQRTQSLHHSTRVTPASLLPSWFSSQREVIGRRTHENLHVALGDLGMSVLDRDPTSSHGEQGSMRSTENQLKLKRLQAH